MFLYGNEKFKYFEKKFYNAISISLLPVHSLVEGVQFVYIKTLPGFSHLGVLRVDLLHHHYSHVCHAMSWLVEMLSCGLVQVLIPHIAPVLSKTLCQ